MQFLQNAAEPRLREFPRKRITERAGRGGIERGGGSKPGVIKGRASRSRDALGISCVSRRGGRETSNCTYHGESKAIHTRRTFLRLISRELKKVRTWYILVEQNGIDAKDTVSLRFWLYRMIFVKERMTFVKERITLLLFRFRENSAWKFIVSINY